MQIRESFIFDIPKRFDNDRFVSYLNKPWYNIAEKEIWQKVFDITGKLIIDEKSALKSPFACVAEKVTVRAGYPACAGPLIFISASPTP